MLACLRRLQTFNSRRMFKMSTRDWSSDYQKAISALNGLQSNAAVLKEARKRIETGGPGAQKRNLELTQKYLDRCKISIEDLEGKVIHVAGTKGKGSTCALTESILRQYGFKTGFYSSPHLVTVAERIRINGKPLSTAKFTSYFWNIYNTLYRNKDDEQDMPSYFKFLTVMAFGVFLAERVDVAIIEVGIGGEYDCTNVFRKTAVVGISTLGLDHVRILGDTIESIAWQKSGIMKPGCQSVYTASNQHPSALKVLQARADEKKCSLAVAPSLSAYYWESRHKAAVEDALLRMPVQSVNCSLAVQLAHAWINKVSNKNGNLMDEVVPLAMPQRTIDGIAKCKWAGRFQTIETSDSVTFYLDGAHTQDSVVACANWFKTMCPSKNGVKRILVFNSTGGRDTESLLSPLVSCDFTRVYFCTNQLNEDPSDSPQDIINSMVSTAEALERCGAHAETWSRLGTLQEAQVAGSVSSVVGRICSGGGPADILVTGSLHLVGTFLIVLDPLLTRASSLFGQFKGSR